MRGLKKSLIMAVITVLALVNLLSSAEAGWNPIFQDDFANDNIGEYPSGFGGNAGVAHAQVVEDPTAVGGKSLKFVGDTSKTLDVSITKLGTESSKIAIEYSIKWTGGSTINFDLFGFPQAGRVVNWYIDGRTIPAGEFRYRYTDASGKTISVTIGTLSPGWNRIRIEADVENSEAYIELSNSSGVITEGPYPFRGSASSWEEEWLRMQASPRDPAVEAYFESLKVEEYVPIEMSHAEVYSYPNPFTDGDEVRFAYYMPQSGNAAAKIYDELGRLVLEETADNVDAGYNEFVFNGGTPLPSGIYTCVITMGVEGNLDYYLAQGTFVKK